MVKYIYKPPISTRFLYREIVSANQRLIDSFKEEDQINFKALDDLRIYCLKLCFPNSGVFSKKSNRQDYQGYELEILKQEKGRLGKLLKGLGNYDFLIDFYLGLSSFLFFFLPSDQTESLERIFSNDEEKAFKNKLENYFYKNSKCRFIVILDYILENQETFIKKWKIKYHIIKGEGDKIGVLLGALREMTTDGFQMIVCRSLVALLYHDALETRFITDTINLPKQGQQIFFLGGTYKNWNRVGMEEEKEIFGFQPEEIKNKTASTDWTDMPYFSKRLKQTSNRFNRITLLKVLGIEMEDHENIDLNKKIVDLVDTDNLEVLVLSILKGSTFDPGDRHRLTSLLIAGTLGDFLFFVDQKAIKKPSSFMEGFLGG